MLIDSHCHIDAAEFDTDRDAEIKLAVEAGVTAMVIPTVHSANYHAVMTIARQYPQCYYALGWHPMYTDAAQPSDMVILRNLVAQQFSDNKLVAIGEIGLDYFVTRQNSETQTYFFSEQLKIAQDFDLPVILHVRKAIDDVLKYLRRHPVKGGIAHAFNGSMQQAEAFAKLGFKLGFGGAMTYSRALKIRELAKNLGLEHIVLETDSPDIPPRWLANQGRNSPKELYKIAEVLAEIRAISVTQIIEITSKNCLSVMPKLACLHTPLKVTC